MHAFPGILLDVAVEVEGRRPEYRFVTFFLNCWIWIFWMMLCLSSFNASVASWLDIVATPFLDSSVAVAGARFFSLLSIPYVVSIQTLNVSFFYLGSLCNRQGLVFLPSLAIHDGLEATKAKFHGK